MHQTNFKNYEKVKIVSTYAQNKHKTFQVETNLIKLQVFITSVSIKYAKVLVYTYEKTFQSFFLNRSK